MVWRRVFLALVFGACMPPEWGKNALLYPRRAALTATNIPPHQDVIFQSGDVTLRGWLFRGAAPRRGLLVYLHGIGDNRESGLGLVRRYGPLGWDVLAYDQRAHGESGGAACTYGFYEKQDLRRALDAVKAEKAVIFGVSLGGSVALQAAAQDRRIAAVIAAAPYADLGRIARERAPFFASESNIRAAIALVEKDASFRVDDVSPLRAAAQIQAPVLLLHGDGDRDTRPAHSRDIAAALGGPKELVLIPGANHNTMLSAEGLWTAITRFLTALPPLAAGP